MNGQEEEKKVKLLGIVLDNRYDFADHLQYVLRSCTYKLSCLRKISRWMTQKNMKEIIQSVVLSQLYYGSEIYMRLLQVRQKAQKLLNSAARLALNRDRFANVELMLHDLAWLNLNNHYRMQILTSFRRLLRTRSSALTFSMLDTETKTSQRTRLLKTTWRHKSAKNGKVCYFQTAVRNWNSMEIGKKIFENDKDFKSWVVLTLIQQNGNANL